MVIQTVGYFVLCVLHFPSCFCIVCTLTCPMGLSKYGKYTSKLLIRYKNAGITCFGGGGEERERERERERRRVVLRRTLGGISD